VDLYSDKYYNAVTEGQPMQITAQKDIEGKGSVDVLEVKIVGRLRKLLKGKRGEAIRRTRAYVQMKMDWMEEKAKQRRLFANLVTDMRRIWNWELTKSQQLARKLRLKNLAKECGADWQFREERKRNIVMKALRDERRNKGQVELGEDRSGERDMKRFERLRRDMQTDAEMRKRAAEKKKRREEEQRRASLSSSISTSTTSTTTSSASTAATSDDDEEETNRNPKEENRKRKGEMDEQGRRGLMRGRPLGVANSVPTVNVDSPPSQYLLWLSQ
jgi:hypothetical protein